jgi:hypothetical protein
VPVEMVEPSVVGSKPDLSKQMFDTLDVNDCLLKRFSEKQGKTTTSLEFNTPFDSKEVGITNCVSFFANSVVYELPSMGLDCTRSKVLDGLGC